MRKYLLTISTFVLCTTASAETELQSVPIEKCFDSNPTFDLNGQSTRIISHAGEKNQLTFSFKQDGGKFNAITEDSAKIKEENRPTQIISDIEEVAIAIAKKNLEFSAFMMIRPKEQPTHDCIVFTPTIDRSTITVSAKQITSAGEKVTTKDFKYGPKENWYISGDLVISNLKELKYNSTSGKIESKNNPATLYLGINFKIGDIYSDYPINQFWNNISLKSMVKVSSQPFTSAGFGVAYQTKWADIFYARISTAPDSTASDAGAKRAWSNVVGISLTSTQLASFINPSSK